MCYHGDNFDDYSEMVMSDQSRERPQMLYVTSKENVHNGLVLSSSDKIHSLHATP